jgi:alkylation response protein AidB-like acyl-CoA dehydrogenase
MELLQHGQKLWSSGAHRADVGILLCRTGTAKQRHRGITAFIVDMKSPGLETRPLREMDGRSGFNEVFFTDVRIPDTRRLGGVNQGWAISMSVQGNARSLMATSRRKGTFGGLTAVASAERLAQMMRRLHRQDDPVLRQAWAGLYSTYRLLEPTAVRLTAEAKTANAQAAMGAISKLALTNALSQAAELLWSLLGERLIADTGTEDSFDWLPYALQVLGYHIGGGTDEVLKNVVAHRGLDLPRQRPLDRQPRRSK